MKIKWFGMILSVFSGEYFTLTFKEQWLLAFGDPVYWITLYIPFSLMLSLIK